MEKKESKRHEMAEKKMKLGKNEIMKDTKKEAKFEHKVIKDARKLAKDVSKGRKNYGK
jgi:hypothetical protein